LAFVADRDIVRRGYDDLEESYDAVRSEDGRDIALLDEFLTSLSNSARVLDAGCGAGAPILREASASAAVIGLDFSREQLRLATANAPQASLVQGDMTALPVSDNTFDAVIASHSLIHIPSEGHQTVINEFARVLQSDGRVLVSEGPREWSGSNLDWLGSGVEMQWSIAGADATRDHLRNAGFTVTTEWGLQPSDQDGEHWIFFAAQLET
jgi:ubiquinone/menaquinone biosynthesis C-methylase UbiE